MYTGTGGTSMLFVDSLMIVNSVMGIYLLGDRKSISSFMFIGTNSASILLSYSLKNFKWLMNIHY